MSQRLTIADLPDLARGPALLGTGGVGLQIGRALRYARDRHIDPFAHLLETLSGTDYFPAKGIFSGKVVEVYRRTSEGFAKGTVRIQELDAPADDDAETLEIEFQNENFIARVGERILSVVPDLICILGSETAEPITTEELRSGQQVKVPAVTVPPIVRSPEALRVWGPRTFGFDVDYVPMAGA